MEKERTLTGSREFLISTCSELINLENAAENKRGTDCSSAVIRENGTDRKERNETY